MASRFSRATPPQRARTYLRDARGGQRALWRQLTGPQLLVGSFFLLVIVGTLGFKVLPGLYTGASLSWLGALFTATSAVCVTGLVVVDTAWTRPTSPRPGRRGFCS